MIRKILLLYILCFLGSGCTEKQKSGDGSNNTSQSRQPSELASNVIFKENQISIIGPFKDIRIKQCEDGGTEWIRFIDSTERAFSVYVDHRIGHQEEWGTIYLNAYPGKEESYRVINQNGFKNRVLKQLKSHQQKDTPNSDSAGAKPE